MLIVNYAVINKFKIYKINVKIVFFKWWSWWRSQTEQAGGFAVFFFKKCKFIKLLYSLK